MAVVEDVGNDVKVVHNNKLVLAKWFQQRFDYTFLYLQGMKTAGFLEYVTKRDQMGSKMGG